jgi:hypothetical protein
MLQIYRRRFFLEAPSFVLDSSIIRPAIVPISRAHWLLPDGQWNSHPSQSYRHHCHSMEVILKDEMKIKKGV